MIRSNLRQHPSLFNAGLAVCCEKLEQRVEEGRKEMEDEVKAAKLGWAPPLMFA